MAASRVPSSEASFRFCLDPPCSFCEFFFVFTTVVLSFACDKYYLITVIRFKKFVSVNYRQTVQLVFVFVYI